MEQNAIVKQMIQFNKATFENSFNAIMMFQELNEKMGNTFLEQAPWVPEEGKKIINEWVSACKKGSQNFKKHVNENFKKMEDLLAKS